MSDPQHAANRGDDGQEVDIVDLWHMHNGQDREVPIVIDRNSYPVRGYPDKRYRQEKEEAGKRKEEKRRAW